MGSVCSAQGGNAARAPQKLKFAEGEGPRRESSDASEPHLQGAAGKYTVRRAASSLAYLQEQFGFIPTLQKEVRRVIQALAHDEDGEKGLAADFALDGIHDYIAESLLTAKERDKVDAKTAGDALRALHLIWRGGRKSGADALFEKHPGILPFVRGHLTAPHGWSALQLLDDAACASPEVGERVFEALGSEGMHLLFKLAREAPRVDSMERAYSIIAALAQYPALRDAFMAGGYHELILQDLLNPMRQNRYRVSPARAFVGLAQHAPAHVRLEESRAPTVAVRLSHHPEIDLARFGVCAVVGFMQGTERYRQKLAPSLPHIAAYACSREPRFAPLVAPALRAARLAAMDAGELLPRDWVEMEREHEEMVPDLGAEGSSLRRELAKGNGEAAIARLFGTSERIRSLVQLIGDMGPAWADETDECLAGGGRWAPAADATYVLATTAASEAGLAALRADGIACTLLQAACKTEPLALRLRARAAARCIASGRHGTLSDFLLHEATTSGGGDPAEGLDGLGTTEADLSHTPRPFTSRRRPPNEPAPDAHDTPTPGKGGSHTAPHHPHSHGHTPSPSHLRNPAAFPPLALGGAGHRADATGGSPPHSQRSPPHSQRSPLHSQRRPSVAPPNQVRSCLGLRDKNERARGAPRALRGGGAGQGRGPRAGPHAPPALPPRARGGRLPAAGARPRPRLGQPGRAGRPPAQLAPALAAGGPAGGRRPPPAKLRRGRGRAAAVVGRRPARRVPGGAAGGDCGDACGARGQGADGAAGVRRRWRSRAARAAARAPAPAGLPRRPARHRHARPRHAPLPARPGHAPHPSRPRHAPCPSRPRRAAPPARQPARPARPRRGAPPAGEPASPARRRLPARDAPAARAAPRLAAARQGLRPRPLHPRAAVERLGPGHAGDGRGRGARAGAPHAHPRRLPLRLPRRAPRVNNSKQASN